MYYFLHTTVKENGLRKQLNYGMIGIYVTF